MAPQTTYSRNQSSTIPSGTMADTSFFRAESFLNGAGADVPAGIAVCQKASTEGSFDLPDAASDAIVGFVINSFGRDPGYNGSTLSGENAVKDGTVASIMVEGPLYVKFEQTMTPEDSVFVRITSDGGSNTQRGSIRKDADSGRAVRLSGARVVAGAAAASSGIIYFSRAAQRAADAQDSSELFVTLVAAAEVGNSITVTGTITDKNGNAVTSAKEVLITALAVTAGQGALTDGGDGTLLRASAATNAPTFAWMLSTAAGSFQVAVANTVAEATLVSAQIDGARNAVLRITFA